MKRRVQGFTLIELTIAVIVIAVLAAIALPSFLDSVRKSRRSEAFTALSAIQQAQERWRSNRASYASALTDLNISGTTSPGAYYSVTIASASATGYELVAQAAGSQLRDQACSKLGVRVSAGAVSYGACNGCSTMSYAATNPCWAR